MSVQLGNVAEWVAAIGTAAAFGATFVLLRHEIRARAREDQDRRSQETERRWTQARFVTVEFAGTSTMERDGRRIFEVLARVINDSPEPITVASIDAAATDNETYKAHGRIRPGRAILRGDGIMNEGVELSPVPEPSQRDALAVAVVVVFYDRSGNRWQVESDGTLAEDVG